MQNTNASRTRIPLPKLSIKRENDLFPQNKYLNMSFDLLKGFKPLITDATLLQSSLTNVKILRAVNNRVTKKHSLVCRIFRSLSRISSRLFRTDLVQIVLSQHGSNTIALKWATNSTKTTSLFMIGDSTKGVGLLKLVSEQILEYQTKSKY